MKDIWAQLARRSALGIVVGVTAAALAGGSFIVASKIGGAPGRTEGISAAQETGSEEVHGGTVERFHGDGQTPCDLPAGVTLEGNWTHGDYVSAWAKTDDREAHRSAAKGPCGKPQKAVDAKSGERGKSADAPGKNKSGAGIQSRGKSNDAKGKNKASDEAGS